MHHTEDQVIASLQDIINRLDEEQKLMSNKIEQIKHVLDKYQNILKQ